MLRTFSSFSRFLCGTKRCYFQVCIIIYDHCHLLRVMPVGDEGTIIRANDQPLDMLYLYTDYERVTQGRPCNSDSCS